MAGSDKFKYGFKAKAEKLSISFREKMNLSSVDPLDAFALAEYLDIPIFSVEDVFDGEENRKPLETLIKSDKFNAILIRNIFGVKIIVHNIHHSLNRQQSSIMHELAHIILDHKVDPEVMRLANQLNLQYLNDENENEAKFLGGCLQLTRPALLWAFRQNMDEKKIADYFKASLDMVKYRMRISGVSKQLARKWH